ncbi:hypothetical protein NUW50_17145 [Frigidibacter sp. SLM-1]|nr:hypothetical protein [Frigidibacter sp. ROC022]MCR8726035.1 hypothetical protein [Frigidibacter sp. ROC022]
MRVTVSSLIRRRFQEPLSAALTVEGEAPAAAATSDIVGFGFLVGIGFPVALVGLGDFS